jgi:lipopolysaccharide/colanic/teichoic acid biosynthesis glycosyltransferase
MVKNADKMGMSITVGGDRRITRLGRFLRKTKLDELPQLWNVLKGEMSFVGPRPEVAKYVDLYSPDQRRVLELRPGITDLASIGYFNESEMLKGSPDPETFYTGHIMPDKIRINLEYASKANPAVDFALIVLTVLRSFGVKPDLFAWLGITPP